MSMVEVRDLRVELVGARRRPDIVDEVSFSIASGEVVGLVGESGSGKTTIGTALLGHTRPGARIVHGQVLIDGTNVATLEPDRLRDLRGRVVAYVPQDPSASLNPALPIKKQLTEMFEAHVPTWTTEEREERLRSVMQEVKLPGETGFLRRYPHQLSGGQQQRVVIAMAFILRPRVIILDEPTTGLDVTTQAHVLSTIRQLCSAHGVAALYVTHDISVVASLAHRILVAYAGRVVEDGISAEVLQQPAHPYTKRLLGAVPTISERRSLEAIPGQAPAPGGRPRGCFFAPRCRDAIAACVASEPPLLDVAPGHAVRCIRAQELPFEVVRPAAFASQLQSSQGNDVVLAIQDLSAFYGRRQVLFGVSLTVRSRECLALVGESGSGKTTLARAVIGLAPTWSGEIRYAGESLARAARSRPKSVRQAVQYIFQSPYSSLNPRRSIGQSIGGPLQDLFGITGSAARTSVEQALADVSLPSAYADRYPDQLSGGERQRVAIARALVCRPEVLICDEVTSALDVSVQASIMQLLGRLQQERGLALLFVTHNLALVRSLADRIAVMSEGRIIETGGCAEVLDHPRQAYTRALVRDTPTLTQAPDSGRPASIQSEGPVGYGH